MCTAVKKPSLSATFPRCTGFVSEMRRAFSVDDGKTPGDISVIYMEENGRSVGTPLDESRYKSVSLADIQILPKPENDER